MAVFRIDLKLKSIYIFIFKKMESTLEKLILTFNKLKLAEFREKLSFRSVQFLKALKI